MTAPVYTDTASRAGITVARTWSADPTVDGYAYLTDQRCTACGTQVTDDDRGPFYDTVTDDGTPHVCPADPPAGFVVVYPGDGKAVGRGFYGDDPSRFWVDPASDEAKRFTYAVAVRFVRTTGDRSWGLTVAPVTS